MTPSKDTMTSFYQQLGKVFYAIAAADNIVQKEELQALRSIVKTDWMNFDQTFDEFGTDTAYQIEIVFDWLDERKVDAAGALTSLEAFKKDHPSLFTVAVKDLILKTSRAIISSFHADNTAELAMLGRLNAALTD